MRFLISLSLSSHSELPPELQLAPSLFRTHPTVLDDLDAEAEARLERVRADLEAGIGAAAGAETTDNGAALERVRKRFFDDVIFPRVVVRGIRKDA